MYSLIKMSHCCPALSAQSLRSQLSHGDGSSFDRSFLHDIDAGTFLSERTRYEYYIKTYCYLTCALAAKLDRDRCCSMIKGKIFECTREWEDEALFYTCPSCASLLHSPRGLLMSQNCNPNQELSIKVSPSKDCSECMYSCVTQRGAIYSQS